MRRFAFLPAAALLGCMSPVEAQTLRYDHEDPPDPDTRILAIPQDTKPVSAKVAAPDPAPVAATPTTGVPRYRLGGDGTVDECISVAAEGFPAIDDAGELVAASHEQWLQMSPTPGPTTLRIITVDDDDLADEMIPIMPEGADTTDDRLCRSLRAQVRKDIRSVNADLIARGFRSMEALAVEYGDNAELDPETPARERPLQVIVQHGEVIVRIPGVKVYERQAIGRRLGDQLYAVHGDRESGTVVLTFADCIGDSCTCDPLFTAW